MILGPTPETEVLPMAFESATNNAAGTWVPGKARLKPESQAVP